MIWVSASVCSPAVKKKKRTRRMGEIVFRQIGQDNEKERKKERKNKRMRKIDKCIKERKKEKSK